jgi:hypothetical protein
MYPDYINSGVGLASAGLAPPNLPLQSNPFSRLVDAQIELNQLTLRLNGLAELIAGPSQTAEAKNFAPVAPNVQGLVGAVGHSTAEMLSRIAEAHKALDRIFGVLPPA